jgi:hypothetical protein
MYLLFSADDGRFLEKHMNEGKARRRAGHLAPLLENEVIVKDQDGKVRARYAVPKKRLRH